ncbi:glutathione peroxidase [Polluticaenibacter yanchengensis]|uniref:Glutathione peroxidase n=1 Tax=Polluticaenibacter yanchengensis TaxID=3014562 RepID=A0ABT4UNK6_9BACT|nr:glutathione peroxidase [Chitinophagaceae bacterium LY-5]
MKRILLLIVVLLGIFAFKPASNSIHQFKVEAIDGSQIEFSSFKGKKILVVNTASKCGFTKQYKELEELYKQYKDKLVVIGFPSNDFNQEKGTNQEIAEFCEKNYGVTFPLASKISVKGKDVAPIYQWLTQKAKNGVMDANVAWNFNKFLLDENGVLIQHYGSMVKPLSENITKYLN